MPRPVPVPQRRWAPREPLPSLRSWPLGRPRQQGGPDGQDAASTPARRLVHPRCAAGEGGHRLGRQPGRPHPTSWGRVDGEQVWLVLLRLGFNRPNTTR